MGRGVDGLPIRVGTRGSALARAQTDGVLRALRAAHPDVPFEPTLITTAGDRSQPTNLPGPDWGSGVFVREIETALTRGAIDLGVHSLKDMPPRLPHHLVLAAVLPREDPRDVLVSAAGWTFDQLPTGALVGTASVRRSAFLRAARPDLRFAPIRGNVDTRCRKMLAGEYDAIVLARAGLRRLGLAVPQTAIDPRLLLPAPGQGAVALQARADDAAMRRLAQPLHDLTTGAAVTAERRLMEEMDGGCRLPVAALATPLSGGQLELTAAVAAPDGGRVVWATLVGALDQPEDLALRVAARLRAAGADQLTPVAATS